MWISFTDLLQLDLLSRVLPGTSTAQDGIHIVQSRGSRGFQFSGSPQLFSFPASQLFVNCNFFPAEFSIVVTLKIPQMTPEVRTKKIKILFSLSLKTSKILQKPFPLEYVLNFWIVIAITVNLWCAEEWIHLHTVGGRFRWAAPRPATFPKQSSLPAEGPWFQKAHHFQGSRTGW